MSRSRHPLGLLIAAVRCAGLSGAGSGFNGEDRFGAGVKSEGCHSPPAVAGADSSSKRLIFQSIDRSRHVPCFNTGVVRTRVDVRSTGIAFQDGTASQGRRIRCESDPRPYQGPP